MLELRETAEHEWIILRSDKLLGRITKAGTEYSYQSEEAKPPYHRGVVKTFSEALAQLGFRLKP